ncbi:radical SAM protein [Hugenholtzia roseola]|uniref:radical SAM protein n=1 Tax=Hugenholtzia roseola TaxID=1002 RepID=UPI0003FFB9E5|nr:radical SAM protein [Hugenholtzia roseola]
MRLVRSPLLCNYYVTYRCNAKCHFCDIWERPSPFVKIEEVGQNLRDLKALGVRVLDFTGGEPLLHPKIADFFQMAKKMGFITTLTTNALRYPKFAEALKGQVDMLHFSLDAPTAEAHDAIRGVSCFDSVMESLAIAKKLGERPDILFTVFEENLHYLEPMWALAQRHKAVLIVNPIFDYNQIANGGGLSPASLQKLKVWTNKKGVYLNAAFLALRQNGGNQVADPICRAASTTVVISPENELVLPCYHLGLKSFPIQNRLKELYQKPDIQDLIAMEGKMPACQGCAINCYMQPSFAVELNRYWFLALPSTLKYNWLKGTWKALF